MNDTNSDHQFESLVELRDHLTDLIDEYGDAPVEADADGVRLSNVAVHIEDDDTVVFY